MTFSALDSALLGPLFATEPMRAVFADSARVEAMRAAEAALARAQAAFGLVPASLEAALRTLPDGTLDPVALGRGTALSGVPVIPFVKAVQRALPADLEPAFHKGATTQDIVDTALALQCRTGFALIEANAPRSSRASPGLHSGIARRPASGGPTGSTPRRSASATRSRPGGSASPRWPRKRRRSAPGC